MAEEALYVTKRPLDPCFLETYKAGEKNKNVHIVRASRFIALTQDAAAGVENVVLAAQGEHLEVYGDRVRVAGKITLPGLNVTIVCRLLEFAPENLVNPEINVSGEDGTEHMPGETAQAPAKAAGGKVDKADPVNSRAGQKGTDGAVGKNGNPGHHGGKITLVCQKMVPLGPVTLKADGGKSSDGVRGQDGGEGGDGLSGSYDQREMPDKIAKSSVGGEGGKGGNGGDGGLGGNAGTVELYCLFMQSCKDPITIRVVGGDGGKGGDAGNGARGGNGGTPPVGCYTSDGAFSERGNHWADGADSGGGGSPGVAGWGGGSGKAGTTKLCCAIEALRYPAQQFAQEKTASLRLICKSGELGSKGGRRLGCCG